jgi:hypothetical protein
MPDAPHVLTQRLALREVAETLANEPASGRATGHSYTPPWMSWIHDPFRS